MSRKILVPVLFGVLVALVAANAYAESDIGFRGIGARLGYVKPDDIDGTWGFGLIAGMGRFSPRVGLDLTFDTWTKTEDNLQGAAELRDMTFAARVRYEFADPKATWVPFGFVGPAIHFARDAFTPTGGSEVSESRTRVGMDVGAGLAWATSPTLDIFLEGGYRAVQHVGHFTAMAGLVFRFEFED